MDSQKQWHSLLILQATRAANDRTWDYFIPLYIGYITAVDSTNNAQPLSTAALLLSVRCFSSILLTPIFSMLWQPARVSYYCLIENVTVLLSGYFLYSFDGTETTNLYLAAFFLSIENAASGTLTSNIQKHQTVIQSTSSLSLSIANATLVRLDLLVAALVPFFVSGIVFRIGHKNSIPVLIFLQLVAAFISYPTALSVTIPQKKQQMSSIAPSEKTERTKTTAVVTAAETGGVTKSMYTVLIANALLYFTVVSPNGIMLVFLQTRGLPSFYVAAVSSLGQIAGMIGSLITPKIIENYGVKTAAIILLTCQIVCVGGVSGIILVHSAHGNEENNSIGSLMIFIVCLLTIVSRVGLWGIDLSLRQIVQQQTEDDNRLFVFGIGDSLSQFVSLCMYVVVSSEMLDFSSMTLASTISLAGAWLCVNKV